MFDTRKPLKSGNHGHNTTFRVSRTLAELGLNDAEAKYVLHHYNKRCKPPWSELELQHKWDGAKNKVSKVVSRERESESFFGFVPDWGMGLHREILQHLNKRNWSTGEIVERFNTTQFRRIHNAIPADFIRQFFLRPPFSRNWRRDLDSRILPYWRELDSFRSPGNFENCVFCSQASSKHSHFNIGERSKRFLRDFWAVEENGKVKLASTQMIKHSPQQIEEDFFEHPSAFYDFKNPLLKEKFNALWKNHVLRLIYWPTLLLGQVAKIPADEIRAIFGLTSELTRQASGTSASRPPMLVTDAEVDVGVKGTPAECPFIDQKKKYVVFGGNGRRAGLGYRPIGRTNKGWLSRLVVPQEGDANRESNSSKLRRLRFLFSNLVPRLHHNFEIIAVAHHPGVNEWRGPDALAQLVMSESGFKWLQNTTIRFFAPADWTLRWRKLLCDRLGYQSIPSSSSEVATSQRKKDPARVDNLVRFLREQQLTQADFATRLSEHFGRTFSKKRVQRHLSGKRDNQEFWDFVWLYLNAVDSHPETRHSRNRPEAPPRTHLPALAATQ